MVGALNLISVAFAVLFVGIGVDFGIQFSVRYRAERHEVDDLRVALSNAGEHIAIPLALAAAATAAGFLSFVPTDYRGVSELGQIAGLGMIIAFLGSITVLPALLMIFNPSGESEPLGYAALAPVDNFMERHRMPILIGSAAAVIAALPLLYYLKFDFNPIDLRNPKAESIATYLDVRSDPAVGANGVDVLASSAQDAAQIAQRLSKVPEVSSVRTLASFVPAEQDKKLALINNAARALLPALGTARRPPPSDKDNVDALKRAQQALEQAAGNRTGAGPAAAKRLAADLGQLAAAAPALREHAQAVFVTPLQTALDGLRSALQPQPVNERTLPASLRQQWITPDGRARVEVLPKGALNDNPEIRQFARAVLAVEPRATGGPIAILESGHTIIRAFIEAGLWALLSITVLLWLTLRRLGDMLRTIIPLLVAGVVTLELCVVIGLQLNFANIIALPLLLGIGVAFKIYYVMAWRGGQSQVLQSPSDARGVFQRAHHRHRLRQPVVLQPPRHVEHGQAAGIVAGLHARRRRAVSAGANGAAPRYRRRCPRSSRSSARPSCPHCCQARSASAGIGLAASSLRRRKAPRARSLRHAACRRFGSLSRRHTYGRFWHCRPRPPTFRGRRRASCSAARACPPSGGCASKRSGLWMS